MHELVRASDVHAGGNRFARLLDELGVPARGSVALLLPNGLDWYVANHGATWSGRRVTSLNWHWTTDDSAYVVADAEADVLVAHARFADAAAAAAPHVEPERRFVVGGSLDGFRSLHDALAGHDPAPYEHPLAGSTMNYTSGTTGRPKGVFRQPAEGAPPPPRVAASGAQMLTMLAGAEPATRPHLVAGPLYHSAPSAYSTGALLLGADLVVMERFDAEELLALVEQHKVGSIFCVPTHFVRLLKLPDAVRRRYDTSSLALVVHGAAPVSPEVKQQMIDWWGPVLYEFYGGTEGGGTYVTSTDWLERPGTVGRPRPGVEVEVLDDDGGPVAPGEIGQVWFREGGRQFEYKGDPAKTDAAFRDDWFSLGDLGHLDADGYLYLADRRADVIVSGGVNIYPVQIEDALVAHPDVLDACVVGVPDDEWGEAVHALVQPADGATIDVDDLLAWTRASLAGYQVPRSAEVVPELPRSAAGKIQRRVVRDRFWQGRSRRI
ncbi:MAG: AMP-binding protein [Acidimicrobiales bacterium]|nr:AMP-binding protein [Acidimicrobiales bacterium]